MNPAETPTAPARLFADRERRAWREVPPAERQDNTWNEPENWHRMLDGFDHDGIDMFGRHGLSLARLRAVLDETFAELPDPVREAVWHRRQNEGTLFELLICRLLKALGFAVQWEPTLNDGRTPDFLVTGPGRPFYVEAFNAGAGDFEMNRDEHGALDLFQTLGDMEPLKSAPFGMTVMQSGTLTRTWGVKTLRRLVVPALMELVSECRALAHADPDAWPTRIVRDGDWKLELHLYPKESPDEPFHVSFVSEAKFLATGRKAEQDMQKKASKYKALEYPLLLAIALRSHDLSSNPTMRRELAWGGRQVIMHPGDGSSELSHGSGGMLDTCASCLMCTHINLWNLGQAIAEFYHNPNGEGWEDENNIPEGLLRLPHYLLTPAVNGQRGYGREGNSLTGLLGLDKLSQESVGPV